MTVIVIKSKSYIYLIILYIYIYIYINKIVLSFEIKYNLNERHSTDIN